MTELQECPEPGVWMTLMNGYLHLTRYPRSDTAPLSYCPTCLGYGTVPASESA